MRRFIREAQADARAASIMDVSELEAAA